MFNKKLIAASIAASLLSVNAFAVDLDATGAAPVGTVLYSSEVIADDVTAGMIDVTPTGAELDATVDLGFTIGTGTSKYVRLDLSSGEFTADPVFTIIPNVGFAVSAGGAGENFAIIEVTKSDVGDLAADQTLTILGASGYTVPSTGSVTLTYRLYETATSAANPDAASALPLKSTSKTLLSVVDTITGEYATANNLVASVSSSFEELTAGANLNYLGELDATDLVDLTGTPRDVDGTPAGVTSVLATGEDYGVTLSGNIGFGTFTLNSGALVGCANPVTGTFNSTTGVLEDASVDPAVAIELTAAEFNTDTHFVCVEVDGAEDEVFEKGSYSIALNSTQLGDVAETLGTITYDTTSIEVPYLTTFSDYNQRVVLVNSGTNEASYSMSFLSEAGTEATGTAAASGVIPAKGMVVLKTTDLVTIVGKTRTSAVIEIEGEESSIQAATQTVNLSDGTTDTVVLNANSVTAYVPNP